MEGNRVSCRIGGNGIRVKQGYTLKEQTLTESRQEGDQAPQGFEGINDSFGIGMHRM